MWRGGSQTGTAEVVWEASAALIGAFSSHVLLGLMLFIFLLTYHIDSLSGSGQASWLTGQVQEYYGH